MNNKSSNKKNHIGEYSNSNLKITDVKIPLHAWKLLGILSCIATMVMYAETMLIPAIPDLINEFKVSYGMSSWILASYLVSGAVMTPIAGKLSDIFGKKKILLIIMTIYLLGVSIAGLASNIQFMILARAIQGIGMSMFPIAFGIIRDEFPREKISIGQGFITSMFASGAVIGLSVGGVIIHDYGWRATFYTIIPVAIMLLIIIKFFTHIRENEIRHDIQPQKSSDNLPKQIEEKEHANISFSDFGFGPKKFSLAQIDIKGAILLASTIISFLLFMTLIETSGFGNSTNYISTGNSNHVLGLLAALGTSSLIAFIIMERRARNPLIEFSLLLNKTILPANLIIMIVGMSMFMVFQTIPILVREPSPVGFGENALNTGKVQLPFAIILLIFGPTSGFIISKLGSIKPIIIGTIITTLGFFTLLIFHSTEELVSISLAILSTGLSLTSVGAMNIVILSTPKKFTGISLGMSSLIRIIGASIGPAVAGMYMQTNQLLIDLQGKMIYVPSGISFTLIFLTASLASVGSIILALILKKRIEGKIENITAADCS
ncbi:MAG TPA: MFS transporter [Nitrososphaeraceae archaeon]